MKALKDCQYEIEIFEIIDCYCFRAKSLVGAGIVNYTWGRKNYKYKKCAINNWKKFAKLNGITKYKIIED
jgi:hypothetical protein